MENKSDEIKVTSRESFAEFLDLLLKEYISNPNQWENITLENFLEALSAYTKDIQGYYDNMNLNINADEPNWQTFADIFSGARMYE